MSVLMLKDYRFIKDWKKQAYKMQLASSEVSINDKIAKNIKLKLVVLFSFYKSERI